MHAVCVNAGWFVTTPHAENPAVRDPHHDDAHGLWGVGDTTNAELVHNRVDPHAPCAAHPAPVRARPALMPRAQLEDVGDDRYLAWGGGGGPVLR